MNPLLEINADMAGRSQKILVVEPDPQILEILVASLARRFDAHVTCVADAESCLDVDLITPHDLVISEMHMDDSCGIDLAQKLLSLGNRPIILMGEEPSSEEAITALRAGVRDVFVKPFPVSELLEAAEGMLTGHEMRRQHTVKYSRMRDMVRRVIRERRDMNRRIELLCKDLVGAQKRLVHRVAEYERTNGKKSK